MSEIIDINVTKLSEQIDINVTENLIQVNINTITSSGALWGEIYGTLSEQTDLQNALNSKANIEDVPTLTSELTNDSGFITIDDVPAFNPSSYDLDEFNNESLDPFVRVSEITSAVESVNGQTGVVVLDANDVGAEPTLGFIPENVANKATNLTSPDNTKYPTTQAVVDGLATKQNTLTNPITGTGSNGQVAFFDGINSQTGDNGLFWDNTNKRLGVGTNTPTVALDVIGSEIRFASTTGGINFYNTPGVSQHFNFINVRQDSDYIFKQNRAGVINTTSFLIKGSNGFVGISTTSPQARLDVRAQGVLSTDIAFRVRNSADTANLFQVNGDGSFRFNNNGIVAGALTVNSNFEATSAFNFIGGTGSTGGKTLRIGSTGGLGVDGASTNSHFSGFLRVGSEGAVDSSAVFEAVSTTRGFLPPRMTNAQRLAIASPAIGLCVYCTDATEGLYINKSTGWTFIG